MRKLIAVIVALLATSPVSWGQDAEKPWETWEPPVVVMPHPNAFDLYQQAFALMHSLNAAEGRPGETGQGVPEGVPVEAAPAGEFKLPDEQDEEGMRDFLGRGELVFRLLQEAMMGECRLPPVVSAEQRLPYLADFRRAARMLAARASICRKDGRVVEAALDAIACVRLSADVMTQGSLIAGLVSLACESRGLDELEETIPLLGPEDCGPAIEALRTAMAERGAFADVLEGEHACGNGTLKMIFSEPDSELRASLAKDEGLKKALEAAQPGETWRALNEFYRAWAEQAAKPYWARAEVFPPADPLAAMMLPRYDRVALRFARAEAKLRLALVALAAQAYLLEHANTLTDLQALVPGYLDEIPADPFADAPLQLGARPSTAHPARAHPARGGQPGGVVIYSVGPDGVDDGGLAAAEPVEADSTGDITIAL